MLDRIGIVAKRDTSDGGFQIEMTANGPYGFNSDFKARIGKDNLRRLSDIFVFLAEQS